MIDSAELQAPYILVVDVGNTSCSFGLAREGRVFRIGHLLAIEDATLQEFWKLFTADVKPDKPDEVILASVNPTHEQAVEDWASRIFKLTPKKIRKDIELNIVVDVENPDEVGDDRLLNSLAAGKLYGTPAIVVDFGTAVTFDIVSQKGAYMGGAIMPGIQMALEALHEKTALLPKLDLITEGPVVGKNTLEAMSSGIYYGYAGMIDSMVERIQAEIGGDAFVVATGGDGEMLMEASRHIREWNPELTLRGLAIAYEESSAAAK
jgi:type III pantothenate kinase